MNRSLRRLAAPTLALLIAAGCGGVQQVNTSSPGAPAKVAAVAEAAPTTAKVAAPATTPLGDLQSLGSADRPVRGTLKINGTVYDNTIYSNLGCTAGTNWEFDLNRAYKKLNAVVGVDDGSLPDDNVTVKVKADGKDIGQASAKLGVPAPIEVNLDGVLRLRVEITRQGAGCINEIGYGTNIAFADAKLTK